MSIKLPRGARSLNAFLRAALVGPQALAFMPAITLGAFWLGGEGALIFMAVSFPLIFSVAGLHNKDSGSGREPRDLVTGLPFRDKAVEVLDHQLKSVGIRGRATAAVALQIDDYEALSEKLGPTGRDRLLFSVGERILGILRHQDALVRLDGPRLGIALSSLRRADLETLIQMCSRLQKSMSEPFIIDDLRVYVSICIGFCNPDSLTESTGTEVLCAAEAALDEARGHGTGSVRAFTPSMLAKARAKGQMVDDLSEALENGEIHAWFQPQVSADTGEISGFEALARWTHPEKGLVPPGDFLGLIAENALSERLGQVILHNALSALKMWDVAGMNVPGVGVNFGADELRNPKLVENLMWELDRFGLEPNRLTVEVLENVIAATENDVIVRNLRSLKEAGFKVDLDDFGTGNASIGNIRRFAVDRIKIDRSYITNVDTDRKQQGMVAAILTLAERLDLETLAEGVETAGEHEILSQLGCDHLQGFGIGRPMPLSETDGWIRDYTAKLSATQASIAAAAKSKR